jgi:hypothetical protein
MRPQMTVEIIEVKSKGDLKDWIGFQLDHYKDNKFFIPQMWMDELKLYDPEKNPVFKVAKMKQFLARRDGKPVGRISGIIHSLEEQKLGVKRGRFGWFESIDDQEVASALLDSVKQWLVEEKCVEMTGPHGFTDLDAEGLLVDGFEEIPTISGSYNYPYYSDLIEDYGFQKDVDYIEYRAKLPDEFPLLDRMSEKLNDPDEDLYVLKCKNRKELLSHADELWELIESSFDKVYGVTPLTKEQQKFYTDKYFAFLDVDFTHLVYNRQQKLLGFFIGMPNLSRGFKKAKGRLFPFGIFHILLDYRKTRVVDFLLAGVHPDYPSRKIFLLMVASMYLAYKKRGMHFLETNRELEENTAVTGIWKKFDSRLHRRSRIYKMVL